MSRVGINQDHQIVSKTRVLDVGEPAAACHLLRPLERPVHLSEVEVAEQRRDDPALRDAASTVGFQHDLQQAYHVVVIHSLRHLGQQPVMPDTSARLLIRLDGDSLLKEGGVAIESRWSGSPANATAYMISARFRDGGLEPVRATSVQGPASRTAASALFPARP